MFCEPGFAAADKFKYGHNRIVSERLNLKWAIGQISDGAAGFLKFMDKILRREILLRKFYLRS
nr:hypothetical protein [uncultured Campylobacter sp.]